MQGLQTLLHCLYCSNRAYYSDTVLGGACGRAAHLIQGLKYKMQGSQTLLHRLYCSNRAYYSASVLGGAAAP